RRPALAVAQHPRGPPARAGAERQRLPGPLRGRPVETAARPWVGNNGVARLTVGILLAKRVESVWSISTWIASVFGRLQRWGKMGSPRFVAAVSCSKELRRVRGRRRGRRTKRDGRSDSKMPIKAEDWNVQLVG